VHAACLYGVAAAFAVAGGDILNRVKQGAIEQSVSFRAVGSLMKSEILHRKTAAAFAGPFLMVAASLVNPYGYQIYRSALHLRKLIALSHVPNPEWGFPAPGDFPWFYALLVMVPILLLRNGKNTDFRLVFLYILFAGLALHYLRNVGFFSLCAPFLVCGSLADMRLSERKWMVFLWATASIAIVSLYFVYSDPYRFGLGWRAEYYPFREVDFLEKNKIHGRIFTEVKFGDYLIFKRYPPERVFIDGRNEIHEPLLKEIFSNLGNTVSWKRFLEKYDLDVALLRYPPTLQGVIRLSGDEARTGFRAFSAVFFPRSEWALVYWDDVAMVFLKRVPKFASIISRSEYKILNPDDSKYLLEQVSRGSVDRAEILSELDRKMRENPDCKRAKELYTLFSREQALRARAKITSPFRIPSSHHL